MKFTKKQKQWMIGAGVALVLAGGSTALVVNHQAQVRADKIAQEEKAAYDKLVKVAQEATEKAETFKAEADVKSAQEAIKKLEEKDKTALNARVEKVRHNWDLVNKAEKNVVSAEKAKTDATIKTAQTAINQLKADMTKAKKMALQQRLDKVKAVLKAKKEKAAADQKAKEAAAQQKAQAQVQAQSQAFAQNNTAQAPSGNAGVTQAENTAPTSDTTYNYAPAQAPATGSVGQAQAPAQSPAQTQPSSSSNPPEAYLRGDGANANPYVSIEQADKYIEQANADKFGTGAPSANGGR